MKYQEIATNDIDELFSWGSGWDAQYTQLTAGPLGFVTRQVKLPNIHIEWNSYGQSVLFHDVLRSPVLFFGVLLDSSPAAVYCGEELTADEGLIYHPGQEQEYRIRSNSRALGVAIDAEYWRKLGWPLSNKPTFKIPRHRLDRLIRTCEDVTALAMMPGKGKSEPQLELVMRDRLVAALYDAIEPWRAQRAAAESPGLDGTTAYQLVQRAAQVMDSRDWGERLDIAELSAELGLLQRTVYDCFARCYGVGPYELFQLRKLHTFRSAVLDGKPFHGKISQAALLNGFHHMGRLTQLYRRHFGETPRQTMKRRDIQSS